MVTLLALGAALVYGTSDFLGGAASRRSSAVAVLLVSMPVGLLAMLAAALLTRGAPTPAALAWGGLAGLCGGAGFGIFYAALATGPMSVVAPVSALAAALLPVGVATAGGERPGTEVLVGVALCLVAIGLVTVERREVVAVGRGPVLALIAGLSFGLFFVLLRHAPLDSGMWPLVAARAAGLAVVVGSALVIGVGPRQAAPTLGAAVVAGLLDSTANALYLLAARGGMLSLAAVLTSLYPVVTVLLARLVYRETLRGLQRVGVILAAAGVALVSVG